MSSDVREQISWFIEGLAALLLGAAILSECHAVNQEISYAFLSGATINRRIFHDRCRRQYIFLGIHQGTSRHTRRGGQLMECLMGRSYLLVYH